MLFRVFLRTPIAPVMQWLLELVRRKLKLQQKYPNLSMFQSISNDSKVTMHYQTQHKSRGGGTRGAGGTIAPPIVFEIGKM